MNYWFLRLTNTVNELLCYVFAEILFLDPKDSSLDFRDLLKHKDHKKRKSQEDDPDWGQLKHCMFCFSYYLATLAAPAFFGCSLICYNSINI